MDSAAAAVWSSSPVGLRGRLLLPQSTDSRIRWLKESGSPLIKKTWCKKKKKNNNNNLAISLEEIESKQRMMMPKTHNSAHNHTYPLTEDCYSPSDVVAVPGNILKHIIPFLFYFSAARSEATLLSSSPAAASSLNNRVVIGILTHPGDGASGRLSEDPNASYIAASYVKFIQSAGARVIPLIYNEPEDILFEKLELVNGVVFTGGWAKTGLYYDMVQKIFQRALERNDAGEHFPLLAICLGFELLAMIISEDTNILETFSAANKASTLQFMENVDMNGTVFQRFAPDLLKKLSADCLVSHNHHYGISPRKLQGNAALSDFFQILTTSRDNNNEIYVSTVQARKYPVTGFQWHPEKSAFEWGMKNVPHSEDAIQVAQHVGNFFISEARKSSNTRPAGKILDNLIYNYPPTYCGRAGKGYDEVYIFK